MGTLTRGRASAPVKVACARCGDAIFMTDRQHRRKTQEGRAHFCQLCRTRQTITPKESDYNFWLQRFTMDEIREIGRAIWG